MLWYTLLLLLLKIIRALILFLFEIKPRFHAIFHVRLQQIEREHSKVTLDVFNCLYVHMFIVKIYMYML